MNNGSEKTNDKGVISGFHCAAFVMIVLVTILSPWCFGSWEMWWFWPMAGLIFGASFFSGSGTLLRSLSSEGFSDSSASSRHFRATTGILAIVVSALPFLVYGWIRTRFPSAPDRPLVVMEAERSLLLFATPVLLAVVMFLSFSLRRLRMLIVALMVNMVILSIYALVTHILTNGADKPDYVLWVVTPWGYGDRAKGPFFCPNHLSALLNLGVCIFTALLVTPGVKRGVRVTSLVAVIALLIPNFLTLSRGGIGSLLLGMLVGLSTVAFRGYRRSVRLLAPIAIFMCVVSAGAIIRFTDNPLMRRISEHPLYRTATVNFGTPEWRGTLHDVFWYQFDRGTYIQSALRAWRSNPVWGIGPGQHSNRWAEFSATDPGVKPVGGDAKTMKRPRYYNDQQHLYEVHSDWTQLLEEYGIVGLALFLIPALVVIVVTYRAQSAVLDGGSPCAIERALPLASLLASLILIIHSFGDFSLQMPSIVWNFAVLLTGGVLVADPSSQE